MSTQKLVTAMTADELVEALKETDWPYPVKIDTDPPREIVGVRTVERDGNPAYAIVLETRVIGE